MDAQEGGLQAALDAQGVNFPQMLRLFPEFQVEGARAKMHDGAAFDGMHQAPERPGARPPRRRQIGTGRSRAEAERSSMGAVAAAPAAPAPAARGEAFPDIMQDIEAELDARGDLAQAAKDQYKSRLRRFLRLARDAGWTEAEVEGKTLQDGRDIINAARDRGEITPAYAGNLRNDIASRTARILRGGPGG